MLFRVAYGFCYLVLLGTGRVAARLATDFRVLAQLPVLLCWLVVRPVSLAAFSACSALAPRLRSPEPSA